MFDQKNIDLYIGKNEKELTQFIIDLCGFTLDEAGFNSKSYAFYLHVAFRHQTILQKKKWRELCDVVTTKPHYSHSENQAFLEDITAFAQTIVTEVNEASQDNWAVKLIKTSYLSNLDRSRKNSEQAIKLINARQDEKISRLSVSHILPMDITTEQYTVALKAHITYLDSLLALPFVLEKLCLSLAHNTGVNYQSRKSAEMLAAVLETVKHGFAVEKGDNRNKLLINGIKFALGVTMPDLPIDSRVLAAITNDEDGLLPFINRVIKNAESLEKKKTIIFPPDEVNARKALLAVMDVHFESLQDILTQTLLEPAEQFNNVIADIQGLTRQVNRAVIEENVIDRFAHITRAFCHFDDIANIAQRVNPSLLPFWLNQASDFYEQLKTNVSDAGTHLQTAMDGLGAFYNYIVSFIPDAVTHYFSRTDALTNILSKIGPVSSTDLNCETAMAYIAFYELVVDGNITGIIKERFFDAYMSQVSQSSEKYNYYQFSYNSYKAFEKQLADENITNPFAPLNDRINLFKQDQNENAVALNILLFINRLQSLENKYCLELAPLIFEEIATAAGLIQQLDHEVYHELAKQFIEPAAQRLVEKYQNERLIPLLEAMLDLDDASLEYAKHRIRNIYSKLKEKISWSHDDWQDLEEYWKALGLFPEVEFLAAKNVICSLPAKHHHSLTVHQTPKEIAHRQTKDAFKVIAPTLIELLELIQNSLNQQRKSCRNMLQLVANSSTIAVLCQEKIKYIDSLNELINKFKEDLNPDAPNSALRDLIIQLADSDGLNKAKAELLKDLELSTVSSRLIQFAWNVMPQAAKTAQQVNETFVGNLLHYYLKNTQIEKIKQQAEAYTKRLNENPVPAVMKELADPIGFAGQTSIHEKVVDVLVDKLVDTSSNSVIAWGVNYLKEAVGCVAKEQLVMLLPYPFLADLALQAIQSQTVQDAIGPIFNTLVNEYGGLLTEQTSKLRELAKGKLANVLGIQIQRTIEMSAYHYVTHPEAAGDAERDALAMFYLQYRELRRNNRSFDSRKTIAFLFPQLLENEQGLENKNRMIENFATKFVALDKYLSEQPDNQDAISETVHQLQFIINQVDLDKNGNLIRAALFNRILIMTMEAADHLSDKDTIRKLQHQAIKKLSDFLIKLNQSKENQPDVVEDSFIMLDSSSIVIQALSGANKRAETMQLTRLQKSLQQVYEKVQNGIQHAEEMLRTNEPLLGLSVAEWEYHRSSPSRRIVYAASFLLELITFLATWTAIIVPIASGVGLMQIVFTALGVAGAMGATATGIGAAVFGAFALARFGYKLGMEIWSHRREFKELQELSLGKRIVAGSILVLKCAGLALAKTIFTDFLVAKTTTLLAFGPFARIRNALRVWPNRRNVSTELVNLYESRRRINEVEKLVEKQIQVVEGTETVDRSKEIEALSTMLQENLAATQRILNTASKNDARFTLRNHQATLDSYQTALLGLNKEIKLLKSYKTAQNALLKDLPASEPPLANNPEPEITQKPIVVDLDAYRIKKQLSQEAEARAEQGLVSRFWQWLPKPGIGLTKQPISRDLRVSLLRESDFTLLERSLKLTEATAVADHVELNEIENMIDSFIMIGSIIEKSDKQLQQQRLSQAISPFWQKRHTLEVPHHALEVEATNLPLH